MTARPFFVLFLTLFIFSTTNALLPDGLAPDGEEGGTEGGACADRETLAEQGCQCNARTGMVAVQCQRPNQPHQMPSVWDFLTTPLSPLTNALRIINYNFHTVSTGDFDTFTLLQHLVLENNNIQTVERGAFNNLHDLRKLSLKNNAITEIKDGAFSDLNKLNNLDLSNNKISTIEWKAFQNIANEGNMEIYLGNNPITCDCTLKPFLQWLNSNVSHLFLMNASCSNVPAQVGDLYDDSNFNTGCPDRTMTTAPTKKPTKAPTAKPTTKRPPTTTPVVTKPGNGGYANKANPRANANDNANTNANNQASNKKIENNAANNPSKQNSNDQNISSNSNKKLKQNGKVTETGIFTKSTRPTINPTHKTTKTKTTKKSKTNTTGRPKTTKIKTTKTKTTKKSMTNTTGRPKTNTTKKSKTNTTGRPKTTKTKTTKTKTTKTKTTKTKTTKTKTTKAKTTKTKTTKKSNTNTTRRPTTTKTITTKKPNHSSNKTTSPRPNTKVTTRFTQTTKQRMYTTTSPQSSPRRTPYSYPLYTSSHTTPPSKTITPSKSEPTIPTNIGPAPGYRRKPSSLYSSATNFVIPSKSESTITTTIGPAPGSRRSPSSSNSSATQLVTPSKSEPTIPTTIGPAPGYRRSPSSSSSSTNFITPSKSEPTIPTNIGPAPGYRRSPSSSYSSSTNIVTPSKSDTTIPTTIGPAPGYRRSSSSYSATNFDTTTSFTGGTTLVLISASSSIKPTATSFVTQSLTDFDKSSSSSTELSTVSLFPSESTWTDISYSPSTKHSQTQTIPRHITDPSPNTNPTKLLSSVASAISSSPRNTISLLTTSNYYSSPASSAPSSAATSPSEAATTTSTAPSSATVASSSETSLTEVASLSSHSSSSHPPVIPVSQSTYSDETQVVSSYRPTSSESVRLQSHSETQQRSTQVFSFSTSDSQGVSYSDTAYRSSESTPSLSTTKSLIISSSIFPTTSFSMDIHPSKSHYNGTATLSLDTISAFVSTSLSIEPSIPTQSILSSSSTTFASEKVHTSESTEVMYPSTSKSTSIPATSISTSSWKSTIIHSTSEQEPIPSRSNLSSVLSTTSLSPETSMTSQHSTTGITLLSRTEFITSINLSTQENMYSSSSPYSIKSTSISSVILGDVSPSRTDRPKTSTLSKPVTELLSITSSSVLSSKQIPSSKQRTDPSSLMVSTSSNISSTVLSIVSTPTQESTRSFSSVKSIQTSPITKRSLSQSLTVTSLFPSTMDIFSSISVTTSSTPKLSANTSYSDSVAENNTEDTTQSTTMFSLTVHTRSNIPPTSSVEITSSMSPLKSVIHTSPIPETSPSQGLLFSSTVDTSSTSVQISHTPKSSVTTFSLDTVSGNSTLPPRPIRLTSTTFGTVMSSNTQDIFSSKNTSLSINISSTTLQTLSPSMLPEESTWSLSQVASSNQPSHIQASTFQSVKVTQPASTTGVSSTVGSVTESPTSIFSSDTVLDNITTPTRSILLSRTRFTTVVSTTPEILFSKDTSNTGISSTTILTSLPPRPMKTSHTPEISQSKPVIVSSLPSSTTDIIISSTSIMKSSNTIIPAITSSSDNVLRNSSSPTRSIDLSSTEVGTASSSKKELFSTQDTTQSVTGYSTTLGPTLWVTSTSSADATTPLPHITSAPPQISSRSVTVISDLSTTMLTTSIKTHTPKISPSTYISDKELYNSTSQTRSERVPSTTLSSTPEIFSLTSTHLTSSSLTTLPSTSQFPSTSSDESTFVFSPVKSTILTSRITEISPSQSLIVTLLSTTTDTLPSTPTIKPSTPKIRANSSYSDEDNSTFTLHSTTFTRTLSSTQEFSSEYTTQSITISPTTLQSRSALPSTSRVESTLSLSSVKSSISTSITPHISIPSTTVIQPNTDVPTSSIDISSTRVIDVSTSTTPHMPSSVVTSVRTSLSNAITDLPSTTLSSSEIFSSHSLPVTKSISTYSSTLQSSSIKPVTSISALLPTTLYPTFSISSSVSQTPSSTLSHLTEISTSMKSISVIPSTPTMPTTIITQIHSAKTSSLGESISSKVLPPSTESSESLLGTISSTTSPIISLSISTPSFTESSLTLSSSKSIDSSTHYKTSSEMSTLQSSKTITVSVLTPMTESSKETGILTPTDSIISSTEVSSHSFLSPTKTPYFSSTSFSDATSPSQTHSSETLSNRITSTTLPPSASLTPPTSVIVSSSMTKITSSRSFGDILSTTESIYISSPLQSDSHVTESSSTIKSLRTQETSQIIPTTIVTFLSDTFSPINVSPSRGDPPTTSSQSISIPSTQPTHTVTITSLTFSTIKPTSEITTPAISSSERTFTTLSSDTSVPGTHYTISRVTTTYIQSSWTPQTSERSILPYSSSLTTYTETTLTDYSLETTNIIERTLTTTKIFTTQTDIINITPTNTNIIITPSYGTTQSSALTTTSPYVLRKCMVCDGVIDSCRPNSMATCSPDQNSCESNMLADDEKSIVTVTKGCRTTSKQCPVGVASMTCEHKDNGLTCTFCCEDDLCNNEMTEPSLHRYDVKVTVTAEYAEEMYPLGFIFAEAKVLFSTLKDNIRRALKNILKNDQQTIALSGKVYIPIERYNSAWLNLGIMPRKGAKVGPVEVWHIVYNAIRDMRSPDGVAAFVNDSIVLDSKDLCEADVTNTSIAGVLVWNTTGKGQVTQPCPDRPAKLVMRQCLPQGGVMTWGTTQDRLCEEISGTTEELVNLQQEVKAKLSGKKLKAVVDKLTSTTEKSENFTTDDVELSVDIIAALVDKSMDGMTSTEVGKSVSTLNNIMSAPKSSLKKAQDEMGSVKTLLHTIDEFSLHAPLSGGELMESRSHFTVSATEVYPANFSGLTYSTGDSEDDYSFLPGHPFTSEGFYLPPDILSRAGVSPEGHTRAHFVVHNNPSLFNMLREDNATEGIVNSRVLSASIGNSKVTNLREPISFTLHHTNTTLTSAACVYWAEENNSWSSYGCVVSKTTENQTVCLCNHLTNFALLMNVHGEGPPVARIHQKILMIISLIGCSVSFGGLLLTVITYLSFRKLRRGNPSKILINLCIALGVLNLLFILSIQPYTREHDIFCKVVAVLLHYFLVSAHVWMAIEAFYMYVALVKVFNTHFDKFLLKCCLIGWGIPLTIIAITLGINDTNYYHEQNGKICWVGGEAFYGAVLGPVALVMLLNFVAFFLVIRQITGSGRKKLNKSETSNVWTQLRGAFGVAILLGLTWTFCVFAIGEAALAFQYLFAIFNSLQGLFIFVFYCMLKKDAQSSWIRACCPGRDYNSSTFRSSSKGPYSSSKQTTTRKLTLQQSKSGTGTASTADTGFNSYTGQRHLSRPEINGEAFPEYNGHRRLGKTSTYTGLLY